MQLCVAPAYKCVSSLSTGLIAWDQPFRVLHGPARSALLWEVAPSFHIRIGGAIEDLRLMDKGELLAKKTVGDRIPRRI
jgi:hypothetical protein